MLSRMPILEHSTLIHVASESPDAPLHYSEMPFQISSIAWLAVRILMAPTSNLSILPTSQRTANGSRQKLLHMEPLMLAQTA